MKRIFLPLLAILILTQLSTCKEEDPFEEFEFTVDGTNIDMADIAGRWEATMAIFSSAAAGPIVEVDLVEEGGYFVLEIQSNGDFNATYTYPGSGKPPYSSDGTFRFDEDLLVVIWDDNPEDFQYLSITHTEPELKIEGGPVEEALDFDQDGVDDAAFIYLDMERI